MAVVCTHLSAMAMSNSDYKADCSSLQEQTYKYVCNIADAKKQSKGISNSYLEKYDVKAIEIELKLGYPKSSGFSGRYLDGGPNVNLTCQTRFRKISNDEAPARLSMQAALSRFTFKKPTNDINSTEQNKNTKTVQNEYRSLTAVLDSTAAKNEKTFALAGNRKKALNEFPFDLKVVSVNSSSSKVSLRPWSSDKNTKAQTKSSDGKTVVDRSNDIDCSYTFNYK